MKIKKELPLRTGVGIALLNHENKIFVGKRIDNPANSWQMPQGGVDENEDFLQAAKRELEEETGVKSIKFQYGEYILLIYSLFLNKNEVFQI